MSCVSGKRSLGLFTNGCGEFGSNYNFSSYSWYTQDKLSGDGCFYWNNNNQNLSIFSDEYVPVDPSTKYYRFSASVKTIARSYNNRLGSGHLGFACYDASKNLIDVYRAYSTLNTTLTRQANVGDTKIYIGRGDWSMSATTHFRSINFYPASHPVYNVAGGYTRFNLYNNAYSAITDIGGGEFEVSLNTSIPNWGYALPVGTGVGNTASGGTYNYPVGSPDYPETWTTYTSTTMNGYVLGAASSGANFRDQTKYIRFMHLPNYNYRAETSGDAARFLLDNVLLFEYDSASSSKLANLPSSIYNRRTIIK